MQDIDFDEIDRAVNSVTTSTPEVPVTPVVTPAEPVVPVADPVVVPAPVSPAARRSTGRFMDVVHSSSDMRPTRSSAPAAHSLHRDDMPDRTAVAERPQATTVASSAFHWPDPIDVAPAVAPDPVDPTPAVIETPAAPLESPFLPDAKIEKRPLGAFSNSEVDLSFIEEPITPSVPAVNEEPAELQDEILLLEEHIVDEPEAEVTEPVVEEVAPVVEESVLPTVELPVAPVQEEPIGPTSITQQYKEHPATEPQESGAIFDTESYHQPLVHTPKKRSGALVIVWILALILVGGGIGAAVYFVVLPMLG